MALISWKLLLAYLAALAISLVQDNAVNALCHCSGLGYRNFTTEDQSVNFWPLGYFGWGQGWHNNHHHDPRSFNFGKRWWEFDPCVLFLPLIKIGSLTS
jgi:stearoyl-CoA desaturase (delta-9 desaturase)